MFRNKIFLVLLFCVGFILDYNSNAFAQSSMTTAAAENEQTLHDFINVTNFYYLKPQPTELFFALKFLIAKSDFLNDNESSVPFAHFVATVAHSDALFLDSLKDLKESSFGLTRSYLQGIIDDAEAFQSAIPYTPEEIMKLWGEFIATGDKEPVAKIMDALDVPLAASNTPLMKKAQRTLSMNAFQHPKVLQFVQEASAASSGLKKQRLDQIIKAAQGSGRENFSNYGFVDNRYFVEKMGRQLMKPTTAEPEEPNNFLSGRGIGKNVYKP